jgi:hypothetical protein
MALLANARDGRSADVRVDFFAPLILQPALCLGGGKDLIFYRLTVALRHENRAGPF